MPSSTLPTGFADVHGLSVVRAKGMGQWVPAPILGLAVDVQNNGARRLYERLGYALWEHGLVIDRWTQFDDNGKVVKEHADECFYLTKQPGT
jgi:hypothetical protein